MTDEANVHIYAMLDQLIEGQLTTAVVAVVVVAVAVVVLIMLYIVAFELFIAQGYISRKIHPAQSGDNLCQKIGYFKLQNCDVIRKNRPFPMTGCITENHNGRLCLLLIL